MLNTIIGAGIGGLTTGLAFEKKGIDYQIYERFSEMRGVGAGIWLSPNALQVFEYLGVLNEIKNKGNSIDRITVAQSDLSPISDSPQDIIKERFGYSAIAIHRAELQQILINKIPKEKLHLGKDFESYQQSTDNKIDVFFGDGASVKTDYLIGADGINSKVRRQLFPESELRYSGQTCWRGVSHIELDKQFDHRVYETWANQIRFGFSRISKGNYYWFAVALDEANGTDDPQMVQHNLLDRFKEFHPVIIDMIKATPSDIISRNDINDLKPLKKWYRDNICLIGDAGHATTPNMGQGGAQAIEDAYCLSELQSNSPLENVFQSFQSKRQAKVKSIVNKSWTTGKLAHWKYGTGFRNLLMKSIPKKLLIGQMIKMYEIDKFPNQMS